MPKLGTRWRVGRKKGIWGREQERGESHRRRQVSFEATPRLCSLNILAGGRRLAPLEEFSLSPPGFFTLAGSGRQQGN